MRHSTRAMLYEVPKNFLNARELAVMANPDNGEINRKSGIAYAAAFTLFACVISLTRSRLVSRSLVWHKALAVGCRRSSWCNSRVLSVCEADLATVTELSAMP